MAFVRVEDGTGSLETIVFPKIFKQTRDLWVDYKPVLIYGRIDAKDESPSLIVESVETVDSAQGKSKDVFIKIPEKTDPETVKKLKNLLLANPGEYIASLVFEENRQIKLPIKIEWSEKLAHEINQILEGELSNIVQ